MEAWWHSGLVSASGFRRALDRTLDQTLDREIGRSVIRGWSLHTVALFVRQESGYSTLSLSSVVFQRVPANSWGLLEGGLKSLGTEKPELVQYRLQEVEKAYQVTFKLTTTSSRPPWEIV